MIVSFKDRETEAIFDGESTKAARRRLPESLWRIAGRKFAQLNAVGSMHDLGVPPNNRLEALKGDRMGQHSIRINDKYRICFIWTEQGPAEVEVTDYH